MNRRDVAAETVDAVGRLAAPFGRVCLTIIDAAGLRPRLETILDRVLTVTEKPSPVRTVPYHEYRPGRTSPGPGRTRPESKPCPEDDPSN